MLTIDGDADYIELQLDDATTADSFGPCSVVATVTALVPGASPQSCGVQSGGDELQLDAESSSPATGPPPSPLPST